MGKGCSKLFNLMILQLSFFKLIDLINHYTHVDESFILEKTMVRFLLSMPVPLADLSLQDRVSDCLSSGSLQLDWSLSALAPRGTRRVTGCGLGGAGGGVGPPPEVALVPFPGRWRVSSMANWAMMQSPTVQFPTSASAGVRPGEEAADEDEARRKAPATRVTNAPMMVMPLISLSPLCEPGYSWDPPTSKNYCESASLSISLFLSFLPPLSLLETERRALLTEAAS